MFMVHTCIWIHVSICDSTERKRRGFPNFGTRTSLTHQCVHICSSIAGIMIEVSTKICPIPALPLFGFSALGSLRNVSHPSPPIIWTSALTFSINIGATSYGFYCCVSRSSQYPLGDPRSPELFLQACLQVLAKHTCSRLVS